MCIVAISIQAVVVAVVWNVTWFVGVWQNETRCDCPFPLNIQHLETLDWA